MGSRRQKMLQKISEAMKDFEAQTSSTPSSTPSMGFNSAARKLTKSQKKKAKKAQALAQVREEIAQRPNVETIVFENPDATWKKAAASIQNASAAAETPITSAPGIEIDMKKTRHEIMKFGMSGMSLSEKADAETALAIRLGAHAEKKPYINYKELIEIRKKEVEEKKEKEASMVKPKLKATKKTKTSKKAKALSSNDIIIKSNRLKAVSSGSGGGSRFKGVAGGSSKRPSFQERKRPDKWSRASSRK